MNRPVPSLIQAVISITNIHVPPEPLRFHEETKETPKKDDHTGSSHDEKDFALEANIATPQSLVQEYGRQKTLSDKQDPVHISSSLQFCASVRNDESKLYRR
jgi:hypothetical protein